LTTPEDPHVGKPWEDPLRAFVSEDPLAAPPAPPPDPSALADDATVAENAPAGAVDLRSRTRVRRSLAAIVLAGAVGFGVVVGIAIVQWRQPGRGIERAVPGEGSSVVSQPQPSGTAGTTVGSSPESVNPAPTSVPSPPAHAQARPLEPRTLTNSRAAPLPPSSKAAPPEARSPRAISTAGAGPSRPPEPSLAVDPLQELPGSSTRIAIAPPLVAAADTAAPAVSSRDVEQIEGVIDAYRKFCEQLDAASAATLWRGVDTRTLSRAFSTLSRQSLRFDRCDIAVVGPRATAFCNGSLSFVRRVGDQSPQSRTMSWAFELERAADRWLLSNVKASER
jgi:hypothetical protein